MNYMEQALLDNYINTDESIVEEKKWDTYYYNGKPVPRVSEILSKTISNEYLIGWANSLGFKHKSYTTERDASAIKGTLSHNLIEDYIHTGEIKTDFMDIDKEYRYAVYNAYHSFLSWYKMMKESCDIEFIEVEKKLVCPFVGGTLDGLIRINGRLYIIDFKTSNHMTYKYFIQLAAYQYMVESYYNTPIDGGVFILWLNKKRVQYIDYVLDFSIKEHVDMSNHCKETFVSLLYSYYNLHRTEDLFKSVFNKRIV